jgi:hypothetical protein
MHSGVIWMLICEKWREEMRRYPLCFVLLLSACGASNGRTTVIVTDVPLELRQPEPGWTRGAPVTEGEMVDALLTTTRALSRANGKIETIDEILIRAELKS